MLERCSIAAHRTLRYRANDPLVGRSDHGLDYWQHASVRTDRRHERALGPRRSCTHRPGDGRRVGDQSGEGAARTNLGRPYREDGRHDGARSQFAHALELATQAGDRYEQAHDGLARLHDAVGDHDSATRHWEIALRTFTEIGVPEADELASELGGRPPRRREAGAGSPS